MSKNSISDSQQGGNHYSKFSMDPVTWCYREKMDTMQSFAIKHIARSGLKGGDEGGILDLKKAIHYIASKLKEDYNVETAFSFTHPVQSTEDGANS